jgi:hypothetical protein
LNDMGLKRKGPTGFTGSEYPNGSVDEDALSAHSA